MGRTHDQICNEATHDLNYLVFCTASWLRAILENICHIQGKRSLKKEGMWKKLAKSNNDNWRKRANHPLPIVEDCSNHPTVECYFGCSTAWSSLDLLYRPVRMHWIFYHMMFEVQLLQSAWRVCREVLMYSKFERLSYYCTLLQIRAVDFCHKSFMDARNYITANESKRVCLCTHNIRLHSGSSRWVTPLINNPHSKKTKPHFQLWSSLQTLWTTAVRYTPLMHATLLYGIEKDNLHMVQVLCYSFSKRFAA